MTQFLVVKQQQKHKWMKIVLKQHLKNKIETARSTDDILDQVQKYLFKKVTV